MRVLVTGSSGVIGQAVFRYLGDRHELRGLDLKPGAAGQPVHVADIADFAAIQAAFAGVEAVVHLAATISVDSPWEAVRDANLIGTYNVFEAARQAGAKAIVFASSNHAVGGYEIDGVPSIYALNDARVYDERVPLRPDSLYGVSKAYGEALGRYYSDTFGLRVHCLRIGTVRADDDPRDPSVVQSSLWLDLTPAEKFERLRATWLSQRDCAELIAACLTAEAVPFGIFYGISDNPRKLWDLSNARELLGWWPKDAAPR